MSLNSANVSVAGSPGRISRNDPRYTHLPQDSRAPPAPIEPSSKFSIPYIVLSLLTHNALISLQVVLHIFCSGIELLAM